MTENKEIKIAAVVAAAGIGERMNAGAPKAFVELGGKPIVWHSVKTISMMPEIGAVILAAPPGWMEKAAKMFADEFPNLSVVEGRATRQQTVRKALEALPADTTIALIHDGARPLATPELFRAVIAGAVEHGACVPSIPVEETVKRVRGGNVSETLDRSEIHIVQTPQAFYFESILEAHELAEERKWRATDDAALIERLGRPVAVVPGEPSNIKITRPADLKLASGLLAGDAHKLVCE